MVCELINYYFVQDQDNDALKEILKASVDRPLRMTIYNSKYQNTRDVEIIPSTSWGGQGLLSVSITTLLLTRILYLRSFGCVYQILLIRKC